MTYNKSDNINNREVVFFSPLKPFHVNVTLLCSSFWVPDFMDDASHPCDASHPMLRY